MLLFLSLFSYFTFPTLWFYFLFIGAKAKNDHKWFRRSEVWIEHWYCEWWLGGKCRKKAHGSSCWKERGWSFDRIWLFETCLNYTKTPKYWWINPSAETYDFKPFFLYFLLLILAYKYFLSSTQIFCQVFSSISSGLRSHLKGFGQPRILCRIRWLKTL